MVIGRGLIARAFARYVDDRSLLIFASGVSDSTTTDPDVFARERALLLDQSTHSDRRFVYFSTTSIDDPSLADRPYVAHKKAMEELVAETFSDHLILRLSFIVGQGGNPNTIVNHLITKVRSKETFDLWVEAERNFLDVEDVVLTLEAMIDHKAQPGVYTFANPHSLRMTEVVALIEEFTEIPADYRTIHKGAPLRFGQTAVDTYHPAVDKLASPDYFRGLLLKYYGQST